ncbi:putative tail fiber assembly-like protein [Ectopseudomonas mendocina NK-01]|nr:putative tail fiber assembly-like protein [Pseudomonas mendocina NK-01]
MKRYYSPTTGCTYLDSIHGARMPADVLLLPDEVFQRVIANPTPGKVRSHDADGLPILIDPPPYAPTIEDLCAHIDATADRARRAVAGDPLRAVEYDRARLAAEQFAAAGYQGEVPAMVAAWAINGRTPQQAADSILAEAAAYTNALELLRTTRLAAKEQIRALMAAGQVEQAQQLTDQTIAAIEAAVAGIGNNA